VENPLLLIRLHQFDKTYSEINAKTCTKFTSDFLHKFFVNNRVIHLHVPYLLPHGVGVMIFIKPQEIRDKLFEVWHHGSREFVSLAGEVDVTIAIQREL
jgi:hypothetical protein